jgi:hypothetical protein
VEEEEEKKGFVLWYRQFMIISTEELLSTGWKRAAWA